MTESTGAEATSTEAADALGRLAEVARHPGDYVGRWRSEHPGQPVVGVLPMNFPREVAHAAGALPVVIQDDAVPVTAGRSLLPEFYCGYTRNLADRAATGRLDLFDAIYMADHCIQLVGAADVARAVVPGVPVFFGMLNSSMDDAWAQSRVAGMMAQFRTELERLTGRPVGGEALAGSIAAHNRDRQRIRGLLDARAAGDATWSPVQLQDVVTSSMVMDPADHLALLEPAIRGAVPSGRDDRVRVHLSGHLCHAPRRELLELIEDCGAQVVDDDLYHGRRYVSTDIEEAGDPMAAITRWYSQRNRNVPCPTRVQSDADWDEYLVGALGRSRAEAVIHLVPKFCEPHMLYYPELQKRLDGEGVPQLQIETEHEGMPLESFRTRVEALVERAHRRRPLAV